MNQDLALRILSEIMRWDTEQARVEFAWLGLMSRLKYDGYQDFIAGVRFVESLADWLQQFEPSERATAYEFVRHHLVYVGSSEMNHLVELAYPETVQARLLRDVAENLGIPAHKVWSQAEATHLYNLILRKSLFLGLSDGARMDTFRRANTGLVSNEQIVVATQISHEKWDALRDDLRKSLKDTTARFAFVFLLDDFVATGTTLLRKEDGKWKGKLARFWDDIRRVLPTTFEPGWILCVHHYIATYKASLDIGKNHSLALAERKRNWFQRVEFSCGTVLPRDLPIGDPRYSSFMKLVDKYYDPSIQTKHTDLGGSDVRLGFGESALPLILEHNTPNNSVALLWAETAGNDGHHPMRPLFRRRQRHS